MERDEGMSLMEKIRFQERKNQINKREMERETNCKIGRKIPVS